MDNNTSVTFHQMICFDAIRFAQVHCHTRTCEVEDAVDPILEQRRQCRYDGMLAVWAPE